MTEVFREMDHDDPGRAVARPPLRRFVASSLRRSPLQPRPSANARPVP